MYGFLGLFMIGVMFLIFGVVFKSAWTGILNRADGIWIFCPDEVEEGIHVVTSSYHPGGRNSKGFTSWQHYFIRLRDGKMYLSKKLHNEKNLASSLQELETSSKTSLQPDFAKVTIVGSHHREGIAVRSTQTIRDLVVTIDGFESIIDFGFRISCYKDDKLIWKRTV
jgi:hypothetical protein